MNKRFNYFHSVLLVALFPFLVTVDVYAETAELLIKVSNSTISGGFDLAGKAKIQKARQDIASLGLCLARYNLDNGFYPATNQGLGALVSKPKTKPIPSNYNEGGYLENKRIPKDPWGNEYVYIFIEKPEPQYKLFSLGPDGVESDDDIKYNDLD